MMKRECIIIALVLRAYRKYDYLLSKTEIEKIVEYAKRKAAGAYEEWSDPFIVLLEDEINSYIFRKQLTDLSCARIGLEGEPA